jgi:hypothetical protein
LVEGSRTGARSGEGKRQKLKWGKQKAESRRKEWEIVCREGKRHDPVQRLPLRGREVQNDVGLG